MTAQLPGNLTGSYRLRVIRPALQDAKRLFKKIKNRMRVRRFALALRFWPEKEPADDNGEVLDLDWSWIKSLRNHNIGELRINDIVENHDNLRVIFFRPEPDYARLDPHPQLWVIAVLQKKSQDFTRANLATFKARKTTVINRYYKR